MILASKIPARLTRAYNPILVAHRQYAEFIESLGLDPVVEHQAELAYMRQHPTSTFANDYGLILDKHIDHAERVFTRLLAFKGAT